MKTKTAISLLVGVLLLLIGAALFLIPLANNGWDFSKLSGNRYQTKSYDITEDFTKISVDLQSADIRILPATDGGAKVISYERSKEII